MKKLDEFDWMTAAAVFMICVFLGILSYSIIEEPALTVNYLFQPQPNSTTTIPLNEKWNETKERILWKNKKGNEEMGISTNGSVFFRMRF